MASADFTSQVLEGVNYIVAPMDFADQLTPSFVQKAAVWQDLAVEMHVIDFKSTRSLPPSFFKAVQAFHERLKAKNISLMSVNMSEALFGDVKRLGLENTFNRIVNFPGDLYKKKTLSETDLRRLLFRYLAHGAFAAVETALHSTCACDENYSAKAEDVPLNQFDFISVINVNTDFLKAELRLSSSAKVLEKLSRAMLGSGPTIDNELVEGMALELLNLIYGHAKSNLNDKEGFRLPSAIPRVLRKTEFQRIKRSPASQLTIMPMVTPMGSFYVEVDFGGAIPS